MGILQARILEWVAMPSSRALPNPGIEPRSPALRAESLLSEPSRGENERELQERPGQDVAIHLGRWEEAATPG